MNQDLKPHPLAALFPMMDGEPLISFTENIREHGLLNPIVLHDGMILDGRNRYAACKKLGMIAECIDYSGADPLGFVIAQNLHRRHLNESQRAMVAARLATMPQGARNDLARLPEVDQPTAANMMNVSGRSLRSAKTVNEGVIPDIVARVDRGEVSVATASKLAKLPRSEQQKLVNASESELQGAAKKLGREARDQALIDATNEASRQLGVDEFNVIYADPPWQFEPWSTETGMDRAADNHYPTMPTDQIERMHVPAGDDAILFLWATSPMLLHALDVMEGWGFTYRTHVVWVKDRAGTGYWFRNRHEILLVGVKGSMPAPRMGDQYESIIEALVQRHSAKPGAFATMISEMFPKGKKLEMFARAPREGWTTWGNEVGTLAAA